MVCGRLVQQRPCKGLCRYYDGGGFGWSRQESQPGGGRAKTQRVQAQRDMGMKSATQHAKTTHQLS